MVLSRNVIHEMGLSTATCCELAADARRRTVLDALDPAGPPMAVADLAREVTARETDSTPHEVDGSRVQRVQISLYHVHLPKLAAADVVSFDADRKTAAVGPEFDALRSFVERYGESVASRRDA